VSGTHNNIIAKAAKQALQPLGFSQKGRSRVWLADHSWWLAVVEFQPSGWEKGSYLKVAAHWLWSPSGFLSFDFGGRTPGFAAYSSDDQFSLAAQTLAEEAAKRAGELTQALCSLEATADLLAKENADREPERGCSWPTFNAAMAAGLAGRGSEAKALFGAVTDERVRPHAERMIASAGDMAMFRRAVESLVVAQRSALGLAPTTGQLF
jgi:hypothetical protein